MGQKVKDTLLKLKGKQYSETKGKELCIFQINRGQKRMNNLFRCKIRANITDKGRGESRDGWANVEYVLTHEIRDSSVLLKVK